MIMDEQKITLETIANRLASIEQMLQEQRQMMFNKDTLDFDEAVAYTKYSKSYLYRLTSSRKIPHFKRGHKVFFDRKRLDEWLRGVSIKSQEEIESEAETYCATHR